MCVCCVCVGGRVCVYVGGNEVDMPVDLSIPEEEKKRYRQSIPSK